VPASTGRPPIAVAAGFITRLTHSGVSPKVIMTLAGHRDLTTTQRYIDVRDEMMKAAVDLL